MSLDTAIYFANGMVRIVQGKANGSHVKITNHLSVELPEGTLNDGAINEAGALEAILTDLKKTKQIGKECKITINSSDVLFKVVDLPFMKPREIRATARREFENLDSSYDELVFDYSVLERRSDKGAHGRVLFSAIPWAMLKSYMDVFSAAGLSLVSCDMSTNSIIKCMELIPALQTLPFILASAENNVMSIFLFAEGKYLFSNRVDLASKPGSDEYAAEIAGKFSAIKQFYKAEKDSGTLEHAYILGLNEKEVEQSRTMAAYLGIQLDTLPESPAITHSNSSNASPFILGEYLPAVGCLMRK